jgi:DeoR/GlpR family transcriptional regulator of sugar metabolism
MTSRGKHFMEERHAVILKLVKEHGRVTVKELCDRFSISVATVRADLSELERIGKLRRTHGGALAAERDAQPVPFGTRRMLYGSEKRTIGKAAAALVKEGEVIFVDGGTTAPEIRRFLGDKQNVTVITPSIEVAGSLCSFPRISVYLLNGFMNSDSFSSFGMPSEDIFQQMNLSKAFCGAAGFTLQDGLTDIHMGFVEQKRAICKHARVIVGLVDHSKIGVTSLASFASLDDIDVLITDRALPEDMRAEVERRSIQLIIV